MVLRRTTPRHETPASPRRGSGLLDTAIRAWNGALALAIATGLTLGGPAAIAGERTELEAEYQRLSEELRSLVTREAWSGAEKTYKACLDTLQPLSYEDHLAGAQTAAARGDILTTRDRLLAANGVRVEREVIDWLWAIDTTYTLAEIQADVGAKLTIDQVPFNPQEAKAVEFAATTVETTGTFLGYLPAASYHVAGEPFTLVVHEVAGDPTRIDVRTTPPPEEGKKGKDKGKG